MKIRFPKKSEIFLPHHAGIYDNRDRYIILWGGRGGAKSTDAAKKLILRCLSEKYFRQILVRKTYASIKDSQYSTIKSIIQEWGLGHLFEFIRSPLEIRCLNGNSFIARGLDKEEATKSIDNPTGIWYEEANQITEGDFIASSSSIRTPKAEYLQEIFTLNPECEGSYREFWIYKRFGFGERNELSFRGETIVENPMTGDKISQFYTIIHSTYHDNAHLPAEYIANMESLRSIDPYYYRVYALGLWGDKRNDSPFAFAYSREKHGGFPEWIQNEITYVSFDFNKNPICASVWQWIDDELRCLRSIKIPNSDIYELCERIKAYYPNALFLITGDASGRNQSALVKGNFHYYVAIKQALNLSDDQIRVPTVNPSLEANSFLVNAILSQMKVIIHEVDADSMHYDLANVKKRADGRIEKGDRNDPTQQADALDTLRYFFNTFVSHLFVQI
jgi:phage terminase large subunit